MVNNILNSIDFPFRKVQASYGWLTTGNDISNYDISLGVAAGVVFCDIFTVVVTVYPSK